MVGKLQHFFQIKLFWVCEISWNLKSPNKIEFMLEYIKKIFFRSFCFSYNHLKSQHKSRHENESQCLNEQ